MTSNSQKQADKYRWAWWTIFLNFLTSLFILPILTLIIGMYGFFMYEMVNNGEIIGAIIFVMFSPLILTFIFFGVWFLLYPFGRLLFSYLIISPEGIKYRYWPTYGVHCNWDDIEKIGKFRSLSLISYDALYLKQAQPIGKPIMMTLRNMVGLKTQYFIPLTGIHGWPQGKFKNELQKYAPQLFDDKALDEKEIPNSENIVK